MPDERMQVESYGENTDGGGATSLRRTAGGSVPAGGAGAGRTGKSPAPPGSGRGGDLAVYASVVRRRWKLVLGGFTMVVAAVGLGTALQDPVYRSTGTIEIRKQASEVLPAEAAFQVARITDQYLETEYRILESPALAMRVMAGLDSTELATLGAGVAPDRAGLLARVLPSRWLAEPHPVEAFQEHLRIDPIRGSRLVQIHFESVDAHLAAEMVDAVVASYTRMRVEGARAAEARLAERVDSVRAQLASAERRLQAYVRGSDLLFVEAGGGEAENIVHERLRQLQQELTEAEAERYATESRFSLVRQEGAGHLDSEVLRSLAVREADLRSEYARLLTTFTDEYPRAQQVREQLSEVQSLLEAERERVAAGIESDYRAAVTRQALLGTAFAEQRGRVEDLAAQTAGYHVLRREVESHLELSVLLQQKLGEAGVSAALATTEVGVIDPAGLPTEPIRPKPRRNLQLAGIAGLLLGLGLAFLREVTDTTVKSVDEVGAFSDRPVLALIPSIGSLKTEAERSAMAEAFAVLRTSVLLDTGPVAPRSLLVTSAQPQEGKTTVSTNLACSLARLGPRVLLIDADVRRPDLHRAFQVRVSAGLVDYLAGEAGWRELTHATKHPGLDLLPAGLPPQRPDELLASPRMRQLMDEARAEYDYVILDSPALCINAADTRILAPLADGVVVVIRSGTTPRELGRRIVGAFPHLVGIVLNDLDLRELPAYYSSYSQPGEPGASRGAARRPLSA